MFSCQFVSPQKPEVIWRGTSKNLSRALSSHKESIGSDWETSQIGQLQDVKHQRAKQLKAQQRCKIERLKGHQRLPKRRGHCCLNHIPLELRQIGLQYSLSGPFKSPRLSEEEASISQALKWKNQRHCKNLMRTALHCSSLSVRHNTSWRVVDFTLSLFFSHCLC